MTVAKLQSVKIKFGEKEIELSEDEARGLHAELEKMFGARAYPAIVIERQVLWPTVQPFYEQPYISNPNPNHWPQITCGDSTAVLQGNP